MDSFAGSMEGRNIDLGGTCFRVAHEHAFWETLRAGTWEPDTVAFLKETVRPGSCFIDIGAWMGPTTLIAAAHGAHCHSFEPDPIAFGQLKANVEANDPELRSRIELHNLAVTQDGAPIRLFTRHRFGDSGSSMLDRVKDQGGSVEVPSTTFDHFVAAHHIDRIDLIKMDIEGGEFLVLPTMKAALQRFKPVLYLAVHLPYILEHFEKKHTPSGAMRRARRKIMPLVGRDPLARSREKARGSIPAFMDALASHPYAYTPRMRPIARERVPEAISDFAELIFSPRELRVPDRAGGSIA